MARVATVRRLAVITAATAVFAVTGAATALAAPGDWTQLSQFPNGTAYPHGVNIDQPTIARFGAEVAVVWPGQVTSSSESYFAAILDDAGRVTSPSQVILANWATLTENPALIALGSQRFLAFSGLQTANTGAPYTTGAEYSTTSADGRSWTMVPGSMSSTTSAYAAYGNAVVDAAGTPVWIGNPGSTTGINWHVGLSASDPAPAGSDGTYRLSGCCAYGSAGARDAATGAVWAAFYSNSSAPAEQGIQVGQILPAVGAFTQAPGSVVVQGGTTNSLDPDQRVAMTSRPGGGVFVAYKVGYPTTSTIRILKVGTNATMDVAGSAGAKSISLSAGSDGRLWVAWLSANRLHAAHSNSAATAMGATGSWGAPRGSTSLWKTALSAGAGTADAVVTASGAGNQVNTWNTVITRTLSVHSSSASTPRRHSVRFTVSDAGDPVAGARVTFGGDSGTTNASGRVTLTAPSSTGRVHATATKPGFHLGTTVVRVR